MSGTKQQNSWLKFFPSDWRADPKLRMCSIAARGLWIEMLCLMFEAEPHGHLIIEGVVPTDADLARLVGIAAEEVPELIEELEKFGVFSRNRNKIIYSRRLVNDEKKRRTAKDNGKNGGNPSLSKQTRNSASVNQNSRKTDQGPDNTHMPESRNQSPPIGPPDEFDPDFARFAETYPLRVGNAARAQAKMEWNAAVARGTDPEVIIAGAGRYAEERHGEPPKFTKQPKNWIRDECWNDGEPEANDGPAGGFLATVLADRVDRERAQRPATANMTTDELCHIPPDLRRVGGGT